MRALLDKELDTLKLDTARLAATAVESAGLLKDVLKGKVILPLLEELYGEAKLYTSRIEARCVKLLIRQQPVASDLRFIKSILRVIVDLSRICEQSMHIAELKNDFKGYLKPAAMAEMAYSQVIAATDCFLKRDIDKAKLIIASDDEVDNLFDEIRSDLITELKKPMGDDNWVLDCLLSAKYLERISDHAVNLAKQVRTLIE